MTLAQLAKELNVTRQAINNRLRRAGIEMTEIAERQGNAWQLTEDGAAMVRDMMRSVPNKRLQILQEERQRAEQKQAAKDEAQAEQLRQLNRELQLLKEQRAADQQLIERQAGMIDKQAGMIEQQADMMRSLEKTIEQQAGMMRTLEQSMQTQAVLMEGLNKTIQAQAVAAAAPHIEAAREKAQPVAEVQAAEPAQDEAAADGSTQPGPQQAEPARPAEPAQAAAAAQPVKKGRLARWLDRITGKA